MGASSKHAVDPSQLPVPYSPRTGRQDIEHQRNEWASGTRGGGSVPADFEWGTNPKQHQEERGAADADTIISR
ncbi:MAG: hypothetical protein JNG84_00325 [Archangium sp.]|nr:hypothetical protein [Archangium sp.]